MCMRETLIFEGRAKITPTVSFMYIPYHGPPPEFLAHSCAHFFIKTSGGLINISAFMLKGNLMSDSPNPGMFYIPVSQMSD